jgi:hypothetical protein
MNTADWALVISICSALLSMIALAWNIWSKFIFPKPQLIVSFTLQGILDETGYHSPFLNLSITNHGPIPDIVTHSLIEYDHGLFRRPKIGLIQPLANFPLNIKDTNGPFSGGLPKKIEVGHEFSPKYWYGENWLEKNILNIGVVDSFNRKHFCRRSDIKRVKKEYFKDKAAGKLEKEEERHDDAI